MNYYAFIYSAGQEILKAYHVLIEDAERLFNGGKWTTSWTSSMGSIGTILQGALVASGTEADERMTDGELIYIRNRKAQK